MGEAGARLHIAIPAAVGLFFLLLMRHFGRLDRKLIIMASLAFDVVGGLWAVWLAGYNLSVAVAAGFIALGDIAVETAIIILLYIDSEVRKAQPQSREELFAAISRGAATRIRPKLMTVTIIFDGLAPIFLTDGLGSDVMRRIALPMIGGITPTLVSTLIVIAAIRYFRIGAQLSTRAGGVRQDAHPA
ncbi:MAG: efflux RND transporter permease subunit [Hyphomonas sp.]